MTCELHMYTQEPKVESLEPAPKLLSITQRQSNEAEGGREEGMEGERVFLKA